MSDPITTAVLALLGVLAGWLVTIQTARATRKELLRLAAIEKRLAAHQEAYALWSRLLSALHNETRLQEAAEKCQAWWEKNCLYLDPKSRRAFRDGTVDAVLYHDLKGEHDSREAFNRLRAVLDLLVAGAGLPVIGEHEWAKELQRERFQ